jgi:hypothetical protein
MNAGYPSAHRHMNRRRHRMRLARAAAAKKQPAPIKIGRRHLRVARLKHPIVRGVVAQPLHEFFGLCRR